MLCGGDPEPGYIWLISNARIRKGNAGLPASPVAAACSLLSSTVKRDHKEKSHTSGILPATLSANLGLCASLPPSSGFWLFGFGFFFPVCRKKTASVCQLTFNAAMKPGLTKVFLSVAPGITSPQILYLTIHGADFAVLLSDPSFTRYELYLMCTHKKKGSRQTLAFTWLRKHLQDLHSLKYQVS